VSVIVVVITTARILGQRRDERVEEREARKKGSCSLHAEAAEQQQKMRGGLTLMMASRSRNGIPRSQLLMGRWIACAWLSPLRF